MARRDSLFRLACWVAFHQAFWVGVGVRPHVIGALLVTSFPATLKTRWLVDTHRLQGGQMPLLVPADVVVTHAADDAPDPGAGRPGADRFADQLAPDRIVDQQHLMMNSREGLA